MKYAMSLIAILLFWTILYGTLAYPLIVPSDPFLGLLQWGLGMGICTSVWLTLVISTDW